MTAGQSGTNQLSPAALALLARRAGSAAGLGAASVEPGRLSYPQLTQWFFAHLYPQSAVFNLPKILTLRGQVDQPALRVALQAIVDRHAALRTVYTLDGEEPTQRTLPARPVDLAYHDLAPLVTTTERDRHAAELLSADADRPFDLSADQLLRAILLRLAEDEWQLQVTFHHVAFDGWSTGVFLSEFGEHYRAAIAGTAAMLAPLQTQMPEAAAWHRTQLDGPAVEHDRRYWREELRGVPPLDLPLDHAVGVAQRNRGDQRQLRLNADQWTTVLAAARRHDCTPFVVLFAAWSVLTARRCNQAHCLLGVTLAGRVRADWEPLLGNFVNVLPLVVDLDAAPTFADLLSQVRQRSAAAFAHQDFPFQQLGADVAPARRSGIETLFPVVFNFRNVPLQLPRDLPDLEVTGLTMPLRGTTAPLGLNVTPDSDGALIDLDFDPDQIEAVTAERWLDAYATILVAAIAAPGTAVTALPVMGDAERLQLDQWNETDRPRDRTLTLPALFTRQAQATPDRIAVSASGTEWTYAELARQSQRIASILRARGIGPGAFVGVCMERCAGLVAAMVGIVEAGAAYVPIDPSYPGARIVTMLEDVGATVIVTGPGTPDGVANPRWERIEWDAAATPTVGGAPVPRAATASDPAYVIFTSGSTGRPKGVVISHSSIVNYFDWMAAEFPLQATDVMLQMTSIGVDASVWEFWKPLLAGARLVMAPPPQHFDPVALVATMAREGVTALSAVPTMLHALIDTGELERTGALRLVCCGGEAMTRDLIDAFRSVHGATLSNHYGPTEATIDSTFFIPGPTLDSRFVPIGRPIGNAQAHVVDRHGNLAPIGVPGELHVAGEGVALGYLGQPELTAERFVADRFSRRSGGTMYRTGDLARWRHDGLIEYLGRIDSQVKLRGFRIELGEIETALSAVTGVRTAAVVIRRNATGGQQLVGYVEAATDLTPAAVRAALRKNLPEYMVPSPIVVLPNLPTLPSGKIDRATLATIALDATEVRAASRSIESPSTTLELALLDIWGALLGVSDIGIDDDFFALGGHSLLAAKMVSELERGTGYRLPLGTLFKASTIRSLAWTLMQESFQTVDRGINEVQAGVPGRTPFFMLTGDMMGGGFYCRGLARAAGAEQPVYAIPPHPVVPAFRDATIEAMATAHLADIRRLQPVGPYRLGGFCVGGQVVYEIARRLRAEGQEVELLLMVDAIPPGQFGPVTWTLLRAVSHARGRDGESRRNAFAHLSNQAEKFLGFPLIKRPAVIARFALRLSGRILRRLTRAAPKHEISAAEAAARPGQSLSRLIQQHMHAEYAYRPGRYAGRTDLVFTPAMERSWGRPPAGWRRVAPDLVIHTASAGHSEVVFTHLPGILRDALDRLDNARNTE